MTSFSYEKVRFKTFFGQKINYLTFCLQKSYKKFKHGGNWTGLLLFKTPLLYLLPNSHPFPQLITEHSGMPCYSNRNVCDRSQRKNPCLITNEFVINSGDIFFVIHHKHVSDREQNILTRHSEEITFQTVYGSQILQK